MSNPIRHEPTVRPERHPLTIVTLSVGVAAVVATAVFWVRDRRGQAALTQGTRQRLKPPRAIALARFGA